MKIRVVVLALACLAPSSVLAQRLRKEMIYFGGMGGIATLSGDANAVITASSASTSSYDPSNGGAAEAFIGAHIFDYFSFQADYVWNRNDAVLVSSIHGPGVSSFYRLPETVTQKYISGKCADLFSKTREPNPALLVGGSRRSSHPQPPFRWQHHRGSSRAPSGLLRSGVDRRTHFCRPRRSLRQLLVFSV